MYALFLSPTQRGPTVTACILRSPRPEAKDCFFFWEHVVKQWRYQEKGQGTVPIIRFLTVGSGKLKVAWLQKGENALHCFNRSRPVTKCSIGSGSDRLVFAFISASTPVKAESACALRKSSCVNKFVCKRLHMYCLPPSWALLLLVVRLANCYGLRWLS